MGKRKKFEEWLEVYNNPQESMAALTHLKRLAVRHGKITEIIRVISFLGEFERDIFLLSVLNSNKDSLEISLLFVNFRSDSVAAYELVRDNLLKSFDEEDIKRKIYESRDDILLRFLDTYNEKTDGQFVCRLMYRFPDSKAYKRGWEIAEGDVM